MSRPSIDVQSSEAYKQLIKQETNRKKVWMEKYGKDLIAEERTRMIQTLQREKEKQEAMNTLRSDPVRQLLYDGVSKEGKGRLAYLTEQRKKSPVKRYQRPKTSAQEVGWLVDPDNEYSKQFANDTSKYTVNFTKGSGRKV